ncbi:MAG: acetylxylan esterase [Verrucomicrobiales bacterium]|nr:acetylxylan esterase [Verrucomicrobiales bacterium]
MRPAFGFPLLLLGLLLPAIPIRSDEPKNHDRDVVYDEAKVPPYDLPPLLVSSDGRAITTPEEWFQIRRPQILALFGNLVYGVVPEAESPIRTTFEVVKTDHEFLGGKATRKDVHLRHENARGKVEVQILVFTPNGVPGPAPAFLLHSFANTRDTGHDADPERPGFLRNGIPLGEFLQRGFGFVVVPNGDLAKHNEVEFQSGIAPLFYRTGQSFPKAYEWGCISMAAWGASRAMDYLETNRDIDARRIAILGHSKMGKATLWTAAQDSRFALAISAQSGCAGAALWKRNFGENMEKMVTRFPYWLCRNAWKFVRNEEDLPVDQHLLLACIAPRPVYVHSGVDDTWADPRGQYLSAYYASAVYRLLGRKGLTTEASPAIGEAIVQSDVGYHNRPGGHSIEMFDWLKFLEFAEFHLKRK